MKKTEKILTAFLLIALGVVLAVLQGDLISILMTALGIGFIVLGCVDLYKSYILPAIVKCVVGVITILFGWILVGAVLYLLAAALIVFGIVLIYERIKCSEYKQNIWRIILYYAQPILLISIGFLLLFNQRETVAWIFVTCGVLTVLEGGILLTNALLDD